MIDRQGQLIVVGSGIQLGRHIPERAIGEIDRADNVLVLADPFTFDWVRTRRPDAINLTDCYDDHVDRRESYRKMTEQIVSPVLAGRRVCAVFYGHPGIFAQVPHAAIEQVRSAGLSAFMEPGISAEACLYADLGIDPGERGVQSHEATRFLAYRHQLDPGALVLLWQVALAGNIACIGFEPDPRRLQILVGKLMQWYQADTPVILYEAARLPIEDFRADHMTLADLPNARYQEYTTLVIPPAREAERDEPWVAKLEALD
ncbi:SAM-dependent methyltransferase [Wenzhouxiangella sp. EGI_FJ10305]|uniref:SAM-dependent methyltransferase n=1 Tax=Wenzhouxiangella sp. EGI_FJ10305 TaxID=3243768 RepID=UPI0035D78834